MAKIHAGFSEKVLYIRYQSNNNGAFSTRLHGTDNGQANTTSAKTAKGS